ncbi:unnamed protein product [Lasius platythorax]|uniref:Uncharacterized protein n=1 Tax=Lasius platythorax TaxID=488582 RepID=A0AAV2P818_9HYME
MAMRKRRRAGRKRRNQLAFRRVSQKAGRTGIRKEGDAETAASFVLFRLACGVKADHRESTRRSRRKIFSDRALATKTDGLISFLVSDITANYPWKRNENLRESATRHGIKGAKQASHP